MKRKQLTVIKRHETFPFAFQTNIASKNSLYSNPCYYPWTRRGAKPIQNYVIRIQNYGNPFQDFRRDPYFVVEIHRVFLKDAGLKQQFRLISHYTGNLNIRS